MSQPECAPVLASWASICAETPCCAQDWLDIDFAIRQKVDFIAVSFVKSADVIKNLKSYLNSRADKVIEVIAKVESHDSVPNIEEIVEASDAVMVARGDLGKTPLYIQKTDFLFWVDTPGQFAVSQICP